MVLQVGSVTNAGRQKISVGTSHSLVSFNDPLLNQCQFFHEPETFNRKNDINVPIKYDQTRYYLDCNRSKYTQISSVINQNPNVLLQVSKLQHMSALIV